MGMIQILHKKVYRNLYLQKMNIGCFPIIW